ncbi:Odorant receptor [Camponotus japonicus]
MDFDGSRYYTLNRVMLSSIGLWPYQKAWLIRIQRFSCVTCVVSGIIVQLLTFTTFEYNLDLLLQVLSFTIPCLIAILKYVTYCVKIESVKLLFEQINYDCIAITDTQEIEIIQKYASRGRLYTIYFGLLIYIATILFLLTLCIPDVLNFIMPLEKPRLRLLPTPVECFVDQQKYFYVIVSNMLVIAMVGMTTFIATETMFMIFIQHACGLFAIAR